MGDNRFKSVPEAGASVGHQQNLLFQKQADT